MKVQLLRFRYSLAAGATDLGQRELVTAWEDACKAAGLPLAYSEGKRPSPHLSIAAPLPQGVTSDCELMDVMFSHRVSPPDALARVAAQFPPGIRPSAVEEVGVNSPSLQSQVRWAEYEVAVPESGLVTAEVQQAIDRLLAADTLPSEYRRESKVRAYDLRPLILAMRLEGQRDGCFILSMKLRAEPENTGRADQLINALGLPQPRSFHRRSLQLSETPVILAAYRLAPEREKS